MIKIEKGNKRVAKRIVIGKTCPSFSGILCGNSAGKLWVDQVNDPRFALVYSASVGAFRVLGKVETDQEYVSLINFIQNDLFQKLKEIGETEFEFAADDSKLEDKLLETFSQYHIIRDQEKSFLQESKVTITNVSIKNYIFRQVDQDCLENNYINQEFVTDRILRAWGTMKSYLKWSTGFIAVDGNQIIGFIFGSSHYHDILPIDIETLEKYRNLGVATELTKYFINYCVKYKKTAYWNCIASNIASQKLAKKAGLKYLGDNNYYYFSFI